MSWDCIVLGAGVAGLAAARVLAEAGRRVLVVEARERVGGRLLTEHLPGEASPVELGAEFVHGRPPELVALLAEAGLATYETGGADMRFVGGVLRKSGEEDGGAFALLDELDAEGADQSFDAWLRERRPAKADARRARQYVEGFNAADAGRIGTMGLARQQAAEEAIEGDRAWRLEAGYGSLAEYLRGRVMAAGGRVVLGEPIAEVRWEAGRVVVVSARGEEFVGRTAVVTLPVGVLQGCGVRFVPEPAEALAAARSLAAGTVMRVVLRFRTRFWEERAPGMRFLFGETEGGAPTTWWTSAPRESSLLVGWAGGPRALALPAGPEAWVASGLRSLERLFGLGVGALDAEVVSWHTHDWLGDPYCLGAYSYAPAGALDAAEVMARPVAGTLFFAGEHTDTSGHPGTVHGALRSGLRAAGQVLGLL